MNIKRTSIRFRLMTIMIFITTIPIIAVTFFATNNTRNSVEKEIISANSSRMAWANQYLETLTEQLSKMFYSLQINQQLMNGINNINSPDVNLQLKTQNYASNTISGSLFANSKNVENISLYIHSLKKVFFVDFQNTGSIYSLDIKNGNWSRMLAGPVSMYFRQSADGVYAYHSINNFQNHALLRGLSAKLNKNVWKEIGSILKSENSSYVFIINDEGKILAGSTKSSNFSKVLSETKVQLKGVDLQDNSIEFKRTKEYLYFIKRIIDSRLTVVKVIPVSVISQSAWPTIGAAILTCSAASLIAILLSVIVSLHISRPIVALAKTMKKVQIHEFKEKPVQLHDEIGLLEKCYNSMMQRIKELIDVEYKQDIELKNAQIMALQAQINPHFLNNTLNLIGGMALSQNAPEIYDITRVMGDLMRYAVTTGEDMVSLSDELKHVENYIFIQKNRFDGRVDINIIKDSGIDNSILPKFTIQPVIENAFEHGLSKKKGQWKIEIRIKKINNSIFILTKDNGIGIDKERLAEVRKKLSEGISVKTNNTGDGKRKGIGMKNVNYRLKLHFGGNYGIRIFSKLNLGTIIVIKLPSIEKGDEKNL